MPMKAHTIRHTTQIGRGVFTIMMTAIIILLHLTYPSLRTKVMEVMKVVPKNVLLI